MENGLLRLTAAEARLLGALVEKEVTTPEYYPLSLNALASAANQRSSREPVMNLDEDRIRQALRGLEDKALAAPARTDGRVARYEHRLGEVFNLTRAETALLCVLLLRGPQTPGELRTRTERLFRFDELSDVVAGLDRLIARTPSLAALLARQPGAREARYAQLLTGPVDSVASSAPHAVPHTTLADTGLPQVAAGLAQAAAGATQASAAAPADEQRLARIEDELQLLRTENQALRAQIDALNQKIDNLFGE